MNLELVNHYAVHVNEAIKKVPAALDAFQNGLHDSVSNLKQYIVDSKPKRKPDEEKRLKESGLLDKIKSLECIKMKLTSFDWKREIPINNIDQLVFAETLIKYVDDLKNLDAELKKNKNDLSETWSEADKLLKLKADKNWAELELNNLAKSLDELQLNWKKTVDQINYWQSNIHWLQSRFPNAEYIDITGLCKLADKEDYANDQDYSLNAGRYVGVDISNENLSPEEFKERIDTNYFEFKKLAKRSHQLEESIDQNLNFLLDA